MLEEPIFRFISVRQPAKAPAAGRPDANGGGPAPVAGKPPAIDLHSHPQSDLQMQIKKLSTEAGGVEARRVAEAAKGRSAVLASLDDLAAPVAAALAVLDAHPATPWKELNLEARIVEATGQKLADLVASAGFIEARVKLGDSLTVSATLGDPAASDAAAVAALKSLKLIEEAAAGRIPTASTTLVSDLLAPITVVVPAPARKDLGTEVTPPVTKTPPPREQPDPGKLLSRFSTLRSAREDLAKQLRTKGALTVKVTEITTPRVAVTTADAGGDSPNANVNTNAMLLAAMKISPEITAQIPGLFVPVVEGSEAATATSSAVTISGRALERLQPENLKTVQAIAGGELSPIRTMAALDREIQTVSSEMILPEKQSMYVRFAGGFIDRSLVLESAGLEGAYAPFQPVPVAKCRYDVGVADLLLVRQTLKAYELADFAHVENALRGESREREHRRLNLTEETTAFESERETEKERNLQSTERNEMQAEASKQVRTEAGVQAGLSVSGSYGPTVSFTASLNANFSTSVQESQRKATSFSREVTERTSERVREKVREERRKRVLEQIEELNRHKIDNSAGANHMRGIYRWLNKVYDAQVFNYGKRMMFEFVIPEPAAYLIYSLVEHPPVDTTLPPKPEPPLYNGAPLKPENLSRYNYQRYVAQYHLTNVTAPPSEFKMVSHFDKIDGQQDPVTFGRAAKVAIPDDYEGMGAHVGRYYVFPQGKPHSLKIVIGGNSEDIGSTWGARYVDFDEPFRGEVSISYGGFGLRAMALGVDIFCSLTEEGYTKWQQKVYDSIIEGYEKRRGDYEERLAASQIQQGVQIVGRNPLENRRMERDELKKWIVMILSGSSYLNFNSWQSSSEPAIDIGKACKNGKFIRFMENAFEWQNMSYICYPYFWGRHSRWSAALHFKDPDPDFAAFLKAGAARVQVPVRPGFETAIAHYAETGAVPDGEATLVGGSLYVPIVQEITESLGKLDAGVPYPEGSGPWEVRVPTSLVVVQDLNEIPGIRDVLTGNPVKLN